MDKKEKKYLILSVLFIVTLMITGAVLTYLYPSNYVKSAGGAFALNSPGECSTFSVASSTEGAALALTNLNYLTPGTGTTSIICYTGGTDQLVLDVTMVASSTNTDLRWRVEFSNSTTTAGTGALWYPEPFKIGNTGTTTNLSQSGREYRWLFASSTPHRYATSTTLATTFDNEASGSKRVVIEDIDARFTRIVFYVPTGSIASVGILTTALGSTPIATSTNAGIHVRGVLRDPL